MRSRTVTFLGIVLAASLAVAGAPVKSPSPMGKPPAERGTLPPPGTSRLDCSGATEVSLDQTYEGDNTGLENQVSGYACGYWYEPGGEVVFHLFLPSPAMFGALLEGSGCDLDLAILNDCDPDAGCVALVDYQYETSEPVSGDIYFVVDGYDESGCPFTLTLTELEMPEPTSFCDLAESIADTSLWGYTCGGENLVASLDCGAYPEAGLEAYYRIVLAPGSTLNATGTSDADVALWLLGSCTEPYDCLAYADATISGDSEVITYTNGSSGTVTVYLVVDFYGPGSCGTYDLTVDVVPQTTSARATSWSEIKTKFR